MRILRTNSCSQHDHPEFRITYDPTTVPVENDIANFVNWLEASVANGTRFLPGETCQFGWLLVTFRQSEDGTLSVWEPDMKQLPVAWSESVSITLAQLRLQKDVVESVLATEDFSIPSMCESCLICTRLAQNADIVMERVEPSGNDSGWFCSCRDGEHDHNDVAELQRVSLYEAAVRYAPQIVPYLALPSGVLLSASRTAPVIFRNGELLDFKPGSFLAALHGK